MDHAVIINQKQHRIDADRQNRSDAINRSLINANRTIAQLRSELIAARYMAGIACGAVVALAAALANTLLGGA